MRACAIVCMRGERLPNERHDSIAIGTLRGLTASACDGTSEIRDTPPGAVRIRLMARNQMEVRVPHDLGEGKDIDTIAPGGALDGRRRIAKQRAEFACLVFKQGPNTFGMASQINDGPSSDRRGIVMPTHAPMAGSKGGLGGAACQRTTDGAGADSLCRVDVHDARPLPVIIWRAPQSRPLLLGRLVREPASMRCATRPRHARAPDGRWLRRAPGPASRFPLRSQ